MSQAAAVTSGKAPWDILWWTVAADPLRSETLRAPGKTANARGFRANRVNNLPYDCRSLPGRVVANFINRKRMSQSFESARCRSAKGGQNEASWRENCSAVVVVVALIFAKTILIKILFKKMLTPPGGFEKLASHTEHNI